MAANPNSYSSNRAIPGCTSIPAAAAPTGAGAIDARRLEAIGDRGIDPQHAGPTGAAQELAPRGGEHMAAQLGDIELDLSDRLAGIQENRHVGGPCQCSEFGYRVDVAAMGSDHRGADRAHIVAQIYRIEIDRAVAQRRHQADLEPASG